jgi:hypothetical protein
MRRGSIRLISLESSILACSSFTSAALITFLLLSSSYAPLHGRLFPDFPLLMLLAILIGMSTAVATGKNSPGSVAMSVAVAGSIAGVLIGSGNSSPEWLALGLTFAIFWACRPRRSIKDENLVGTETSTSDRSPTPDPLAFLGIFSLSFPLGLGLLLRVLAIRAASTTRHIVDGIVQIPENWRFTTMVSDVFNPPELIPGDRLFVYGETYSLARINRRGEKLEPHLYAMGLTFIPILYLPTMLWRWSIKSTAWFYIPWVWTWRGWQTLNDEELIVWAQSYSTKVLNWAWLLLGWLSLAMVAVTLFSIEKWFSLQRSLEGGDAPTTFMGLLASLDWIELWHQPWLWFYIPSYLLTVAIFFSLDSIAKDIRHGGAPLESRAPKMRFWMHVSNVRAVLTNIGLAIALWYFLSAVGAWEQVRSLIPASDLAVRIQNSCCNV